MTDPQNVESLADEVVPELAPAPTVVRKFDPAPWHRPRKQYIRKYQWNHEIVEQVIKERAKNVGADAVLRVFGLPSSEYLDLLSMRGLCEQYGLMVSYLGFNASQARASGGSANLGDDIGVDIYQELQARRMLDTSSFVHPSSTLVPDLFERIHIDGSVSRNILNRFNDFDVINLDICGCIAGLDSTHASSPLKAISELLRRQSTQRLTPWLLFVTTFASANEINLEACLPLVNAVKSNADAFEAFRSELRAQTALEPEDLVSWFSAPGAHLPKPSRFIRIFAMAMGKWLMSRLRLPTPPSFVSMLPSYCFRHKDLDDPQLLSLAYLIEPAPSAGEPGVDPVSPGPPPDHSLRYQKHAIKIIKKSFELRDLDERLREDGAARTEVADETEALLTDCGFDQAEVSAFLEQYR